MRPRALLWRGERGSATVLAVAGTGALLLCLVGGLAVTSAVHAGHRARAAADLAALAAASALQQGVPADSACLRGRAVAAANGADLRSCAAASDGSVEIGVTVPLPLALPTPVVRGEARARARAGPRP